MLPNRSRAVESVPGRWNNTADVRDYCTMNCELAREALSARIDGEREPVPAARVDEHVAGCEPCRVWQAAAVDQTQLLRRAAGRSQLAAVRPPGNAVHRGRSLPGSRQRWALGAVGVAQVALGVAQGSGAHLGLHHAAGHVLNESTAWSAALGVAMLAAAVRPSAAAGLAWVLGSFTVLLSAYVVADAAAGRVTLDRALTHLPVLAGAVLAVLVWRRYTAGGPAPDASAVRGAITDDIVLPGNASRGRRRGHLRPSDGSAA